MNTRKRKVFHVVGARGSWDVKLEGRKSTLSHHTSKVKAVASAKSVARRSSLSQVKVHDLRGRIQTEYTYGMDPANKPG